MIIDYENFLYKEVKEYYDWIENEEKFNNELKNILNSSQKEVKNGCECIEFLQFS